MPQHPLTDFRNTALVTLDGLIMVHCRRRFLFALVSTLFSVFPVPSRSETDALERFNQAMHEFNQKYYTTSTAEASQFVSNNVPEDVRRGMSNFFTNLGEPVVAIVDLTAGDADNAGIATRRFFYNLLFGYGGVFDRATDAGITPKPAKTTKPRNLGQAMCAAGWPDGPFVVLPFYGPSTVGDLLGSTLPVLAGYVALGEVFWIYRASSQVASTMAVPKPGAEEPAAIGEDHAYWLDKQRYLAAREATCNLTPGIPQASR